MSAYTIADMYVGMPIEGEFAEIGGGWDTISEVGDDYIVVKSGYDYFGTYTYTRVEAADFAEIREWGGPDDAELTRNIF